MKLDITQLSQLSEFSKQFIRKLKPGDVVFFHGDLGTGKTTLIQHILKNLNHSGHVKSPTYTLYDSYETDLTSVYHMDLYRMSSPEELYYLGIEEIFNSTNIVLIEWPEKGFGVLPQPNFEIFLDLISEKSRELRLVSN